MSRDYIELEGPGGGRRLVDLSSIVAVVESVPTASRGAAVKMILENGDKVAVSEESFARLRARLIRGEGKPE